MISGLMKSPEKSVTLEAPKAWTGFVGCATRAFDDRDRIVLPHDLTFSWNNGEFPKKCSLTPILAEREGSKFVCFFPTPVLRKGPPRYTEELKMRYPAQMPDENGRLPIGKLMHELIACGNKGTFIGMGPYFVIGKEPNGDQNPTQMYGLEDSTLIELLTDASAQKFLPEHMALLGHNKASSTIYGTLRMFRRMLEDTGRVQLDFRFELDGLPVKGRLVMTAPEDEDPKVKT